METRLNWWRDNYYNCYGHRRVNSEQMSNEEKLSESKSNFRDYLKKKYKRG